MPHRSVKERTDLLARSLLSADRFVACKLEVRTHLDEKLFTVGGCWDTVARCYIDRPCETRILKLKESQLESGRAIGTYIRQRRNNDDSRVALMLMIGNRGGGKTFVLGGALMVVLALLMPGCWQMGVSITAKQNREIKTAIAAVSAPEWVTQDVTDFRDPRTQFITGSTILWLTSKNPKALRQALLPFEHVLINEGQDQREVVFTNSISAIRSGGLVTVASNPPQEGTGDWVAVLYQGIEAGNKDGATYVLDSAKNDGVSQPTLGKIGRLLHLVNPDAYAADSLGEIKLSGNLGYPGFSRKRRTEDNSGRWLCGHVGDPPNLTPPELAWHDVTREITAAEGGGSAGYDYIVGGDFQTEPGSCAAVGKLYRTPSANLVLWIKAFVVTNGTEQDLTIALQTRGYFPGPVDHDGRPAASAVIIGDATGARQNAEHRKRDPYSFTRLRSDGWTVLPPAYYGPKRTPWNPLVADSRKQMKACFLVGSILISPECNEASNGFPALIDSFERAKVNTNGKFEKKGHYTHGPDGVRYLAWRYLPRGIVQAPGGIDRATYEQIKGIRLLTSG